MVQRIKSFVTKFPGHVCLYDRIERSLKEYAKYIIDYLENNRRPYETKGQILNYNCDISWLDQEHL